MRFQKQLFYGIATCIMAAVFFYLAITGLYVSLRYSTVNSNVAYMESHVAFKSQIAKGQAFAYEANHVRSHFLNNLSYDNLRKIAGDHWKYHIEVNGDIANSHEILTNEERVVIRIIQRQTEPLLPKNIHDKGSVTGGDEEDTICSHLEIVTGNDYEVSTNAYIEYSNITNEHVHITEVTIVVHIKEDENILLVPSPVFEEIGVEHGVFPRIIRFVKF